MRVDFFALSGLASFVLFVLALVLSSFSLSLLGVPGVAFFAAGCVLLVPVLLATLFRLRRRRP
jgi:hypothetical protein